MAVRQKGSAWQVDVTFAGQRAPRVSCSTKAEAERVEADFLLKLKAGVPVDQLAPKVNSRPAIRGTLGDALQATLQDRWRGNKSELSSYANGDAWVRELGRDFDLRALTVEVIGGVCDRWGAGGNAAGTINRKLAALSVILKLAHERGLIDRVPRLPKRKEYEGRLRYYSDAEAESLIRFVAGDPEMWALFRVALETGMRLGELLGLTKRDIDFKGRKALLGETKGNKRRSVPLTSLAIVQLLLVTDGKRDHDNVFPARLSSRNIGRQIAAWKFAEGIPETDEACFHTFRHTTCSRLVQRGVSLPVVQRFMGHADITTTMRYAHLAPDDLEQAREALEGNT